MLKSINCTIRGTSPLLHHSCLGADPLHPMTKEMKKISGKRKKTDEDYEEMAKFEYIMGLYYDEKVGVYVPAINVESALKGAAKLQKQGKQFERGLFVGPDYIPLQYEGPKTPQELFADHRFRDSRSVKVQQARLMRTRPRFDAWLLKFSVQFDENMLDATVIEHTLIQCGKYIGLGDFRPRYGRFDVVEVK